MQNISSHVKFEVILTAVSGLPIICFNITAQDGGTGVIQVSERCAPVAMHYYMIVLQHRKRQDGFARVYGRPTILHTGKVSVYLQFRAVISGNLFCVGGLVVFLLAGVG